MNWKQRGLAAIGAVAFTAGFIAMPAVAAAPKVGVGTVSNCKFSGTVKFSPGLTTTAKVSTTTINTKITCAGGTGDGLTIATGTSVATEKTSTASCTGLTGTTTHKMYISTKWVTKAGKPALANSNGLITKITSIISGQKISFNANGKISAGSFSKAPKNDLLAHTLIKESLNSVVAKCGTAGGLTLLTILPTSALTIN